MQEAVFALTPSPNLSPKGERNMKHEVEVRGSLLGARHSAPSNDPSVTTEALTLAEKASRA
jgi:hypothetical protein